MTNPFEPRNDNAGCLKVLGIGFLVVVVGGTLWAFASTAFEEERPAVGTSQQAESACEDNISQQLKTPSTADYVDVESTSTGSNAWSVTGSVDSENSFGARVRTDWTCAVTFDSDREVYSTNTHLLD